MIDFIKSIIPNIIFFIGYAFISVGTKLHKVFKTEAGKQMILMESFQGAVQNALQKALAKTDSSAPTQSGSAGGFFIGDGNETKH